MPDSVPTSSTERSTAEAAKSERRGFFGTLSTILMAGGLASGYGTLAAFAGRFLFPSQGNGSVWQFVAGVDQLVQGQSIPFRTPSGAKIVIARQGDRDTADAFVALSSVCPHLGCAVHWESQNDRFFCPCHNGAFDSSGKATEGPPAAANQQLTRFPLKVEKGLLYIEVSQDTLSQTAEA